MANNSRGLVVSPCPMRLVLPDGRTMEVTLFALLKSDWDAAITAAVLANVERGLEGAELRSIRKQFKGWSYGSICPPSTTVAFDMPNPRLYSLPLGSELPTYFGALEHLPLQFLNRLVRLWETCPRNHRSDNVRAFLTHHQKHGGNGGAFIDLLKEQVKVLEGGQKDPGRIRVEHGELLLELLGEWLAAVRSTSTPAKNTSLRPDLKLVALVHALRYITKDKSANITATNAQALAMGAGSEGKYAGRDLRKHYDRYSMGMDQHAQRLDDGRPHTVKRRYLDAITKLEKYPAAKAMAEAELQELHERG